MIRSWLVIVGLALCPRLAVAGDDRGALEAEHVRLSEEIRMMAARNAWKGVEANYGRLEDLAAQGVPLTTDDYWYGAQAARSLGDLSRAHARLKQAQALGPHEAIDQWVADIERSYGVVELTVDARVTGTVALVPAEMPFDPEGRSTVEAAQESIAETRAYRGMLPVGRYELGSRSFEVGADGQIASVTVAGSAPETTVASVGPRAAIGVGVTSVGESTVDSLQPRGFLAETLRLGVGVELGIAKRTGWFLEAGYHGMRGAPLDAEGHPLPERESVALRPNLLHLAYGWTGLALRTDDVLLSIGPTVAIGGGAVTGVDPGCASGCGGIGGGDPEALEYQRLSGSLRAIGGSAGVLWPVMNLAGGVRGGLDLVGGVYHDGARIYPWATLAYAVAPAAQRR